MDAAKWTEEVSDSTVDDQITKQLLDLPTDDNDNRKSRDSQELEALRRIYEQICAIRNNHAQIVAENTAKRAEVCALPSMFIHYFILTARPLTFFSFSRNSAIR